MKKLILLLVLGIFTGCATVSPYIPAQTPAQITAEVSTIVYAAYIITPVAYHTQFVSYSSQIVQELNLFTSGNLPVPAVFQQDLINLFPQGTEFIVSLIIDGISGIYSLEYSKLIGNHTALIADINALADGIHNGVPAAIQKAKLLKVSFPVKPVKPTVT